MGKRPVDFVGPYFSRSHIHRATSPERQHQTKQAGFILTLPVKA